MVTVQHRIKRLPPSTIGGETLILESIYTSYDKSDIDRIQKQYEDVIGGGTIQQFERKEQGDEYID